MDAKELFQFIKENLSIDIYRSHHSNYILDVKLLLRNPFTGKNEVISANAVDIEIENVPVYGVR
jgi:hypothetical protein